MAPAKMCSVLALLVLHCGLQGAAAFRAPLARRPLTARHATGEEDLARLREEIAELEKDLQIKKPPPPPVDAPKPERRRPAGGAAIVDGRVRVDSVVAKLDAALLPAGVDADDEKSKFAEFCLFDAMTGEGLKHVELGGLRAVTVDGSEELILLLSGLEDVSPGDDVSVSEIKAETDKFVATLSKYAGEGDADAVWEKVGAAYENDGSDGGGDGDEVADGDGDEVFGIDLSDAATLTPQVLSYRVGERFAESAADHWRDWCAVATAREARRGPSGELLTTGEAALYGAALEKLRGRIDFDAVSSAAFAAEVAANATSNDETFAQSVGLFEFAFRAALKRAAAVPPGDRTAADLEAVWTALNVATLRTAQRAELVRDVAGYFFNAVTASPASELVLDKLKNFNLVPDDETDPEKLRDAFVDRAATAFAGAVAVFNVLAGLLSFALLYGVFSLVIEPLFGFLGDAASGALDPAAPRDTITDFFAQRP